GQGVQHVLDRRRAVVRTDQHRRMVGVERERLTVVHLLLGAVEAVDGRAVVGPAHPGVGGPEAELRDVGIALHGVDRGEQGRGIDAVTDGVLGDGHGLSPLMVAPGDRFGPVRFAARGRRHIGTGYGSTDIGDHYGWPAGRDGARRATLGDVTTLGAAKDAEVTAREAEVLALIARHLTNAQIAEALFISRRTVETHVSALLRKLQLPDRRSLARHAEAMPGLLVKSGRRGLPL